MCIIARARMCVCVFCVILSNCGRDGPRNVCTTCACVCINIYTVYPSRMIGGCREIKISLPQRVFFLSVSLDRGANREKKKKETKKRIKPPRMPSNITQRGPVDTLPYTSYAVLRFGDDDDARRKVHVI